MYEVKFVIEYVYQWSRNCLPFRSTWVHPLF